MDKQCYVRISTNHLHIFKDAMDLEGMRFSEISMDFGPTHPSKLYIADTADESFLTKLKLIIPDFKYTII